MIKGIVKLGNDTAPGVVIYESNATGTALKRNNVYLNTTTDLNGNWNLNIPASNNFFVTVQYIGYKKTFKTNEIPGILNLDTTGTSLPDIEVTAKRTYWWLLLLIVGGYLIYKKSKKSKK
jgi:hypothetical protein